MSDTKPDTTPLRATGTSRRWYLCLAAAALLLVFGRPAGQYAGFCFARWEFIKEDERNRAVYNFLRERNIQRLTGVGGAVIRIEDNGFHYSDYASFKRTNPDCCSYSERGPENIAMKTYAQLSGGQRYFVRVQYSPAHPDQTRILGEEPYVYHLSISNCAEVGWIRP